MLTYFVIAPVLIASFLFLWSTNDIARIAAVVFQAALFAASVYLIAITRDNVVVTYIGDYYGFLGIALRANHLAADFVFITTLIFLVISIYSFREKRDMPLFWFLLFLMEASIIGLFLSGDVFNIFVLVEVNTIVTVILVMYNRKSRHTFHAMLFLMANVVAAQFYLFGAGYVYMISGTLDLEVMTYALTYVDSRDQALPYALIITSIAFKAALVPFFSWAPKVKIYPGSPTVVQAILSGLQIKTAVYLFIRFQEVFHVVSVNTSEFFMVLGILAGIFGAFMAICQSNIKLILAYHTISQVGLIILGINFIDTNFAYEYSRIGGYYHIFSHAIFKTTLFLGAGIIIHSYGTANVYQIRGVFKRMPVVAIATGAAVLGIAGAPFFIGSMSKYFIAYDLPLWLNLITIVISFGTIASFTKFSTIFFGNCDLKGDVDKPEFCKTAPTLFLGSLCLLGGVFGPTAIYFLFRQDVSVIIGSYIEKTLIFFASAAIAYAAYVYIISGNKTLAGIGKMGFGFRTVCTAIGIFFAAILVYVGVIFT